MQKLETYTFRLDAALKKAFNEAVNRLDRTGSQMLRDYMRYIVKEDAKTKARKDGR